MKPLIVLDIETTGLDPKRHGMLSLGAVDLTTRQEFYGECHIYHDTEVDPEAMGVNGMDIEKHRPGGGKVSPHKLYLEFIQWRYNLDGVDRQSRDILGGHNVGHLDILFLEELHKPFTEGVFENTHLHKFPFSYRTVDLHSVAYQVLGESLKHSDICRALGLPPEPKPHNALEGARSEAAAFRVLFGMRGQSIFRVTEEGAKEVNAEPGTAFAGRYMRTGNDVFVHDHRSNSGVKWRVLKPGQYEEVTP